MRRSEERAGGASGAGDQASRTRGLRRSDPREAGGARGRRAAFVFGESAMRFFALAAFALCLPLAAHAQQNQPPAPSAQPKEPFTPGLGEIMTLQQMRHLKLWFAGQAGNWPLAAY